MSLSHAASAIKSRGICILPCRLDLSEISSIAYEGHVLAEDKLAFVSCKRKPDGSFTVNLVPARIARDDGWVAVPNYHRIKTMPTIRATLDAYLGKGWGTPNFIYHYTGGPTEAEQFGMHFDVFEGSKCLKVYIYLTDCDAKNGAFRYVPFSHRLAYMVQKYLPKNKYQGENGLEELVELLDKHVQYEIEPNLLLCRTILKDILKDPERAYDHVVSAPAGTIIIFDTLGVHGGGQVYQGHRYIARYHFVDRGYVFRHLPDQLPAYSRPLSMAARLMRKVGRYVAAHAI